MASLKLEAGSKLPSVITPRVGGGEARLCNEEGWTAVIVYRGKHCPICKAYLQSLNQKLDEFLAAGVSVVAVSGDPQTKAESQTREEGWRFPVAYGLTIDQMKSLGLYVSSPRSPQEADLPFPEPGLFVVNPQGQLQIIDVSNAPFSRPDLDMVLRGIKFIQEKNYPIRGTYA